MLGAGCGAGGLGPGAVLTVYVSGPMSGRQAAAGRRLCAGARRTLAREGARVGPGRVRVVCLDDARGGGWDLAAVGANARRAGEDATAVGYIGELEPAATRFSRSITEADGLAQLTGRSGAAAMAELLGALRQSAGAESIRSAVFEKLG